MYTTWRRARWLMAALCALGMMYLATAAVAVVRGWSAIERGPTDLVAVQRWEPIGNEVGDRTFANQPWRPVDPEWWDPELAWHDDFLWHIRHSQDERASFGNILFSRGATGVHWGVQDAVVRVRADGVGGIECPRRWWRRWPPDVADYWESELESRQSGDGRRLQLRCHAHADPAAIIWRDEPRLSFEYRRVGTTAAPRSTDDVAAQTAALRRLTRAWTAGLLSLVVAALLTRLAPVPAPSPRAERATTPYRASPSGAAASRPSRLGSVRWAGAVIALGLLALMLAVVRRDQEVVMEFDELGPVGSPPPPRLPTWGYSEWHRVYE